jgi:hypothetical protein
MVENFSGIDPQRLGQQHCGTSTQYAKTGTVSAVNFTDQ